MKTLRQAIAKKSSATRVFAESVEHVDADVRAAQQRDGKRPGAGHRQHVTRDLVGAAQRHAGQFARSKINDDEPGRGHQA
jgi:hypothetical protein